MARPEVKAAEGQVISSFAGKMPSWNICTNGGNWNQYGNAWVKEKYTGCLEILGVDGLFGEEPIDPETGIISGDGVLQK